MNTNITNTNPIEDTFQVKLKNTLFKSETLKNLLSNNLRINHDVFVAKVMATVMPNEKLRKCDIKSILSCCIKSAQLGLPVDASGYAYIIPRWSSNLSKDEATFQVGYKGLIELARRNKEVKSITAFEVYEDEYKNKENFYEDKANEIIKYVANYDAVRTQETLKLVVAVITYTNGGKEWDVMTKQEVDKVKSVNVKKDKYGKDYFSPWTDWYIEMAKKSVLKRLLKKSCLMNIDLATELDEEFDKNDLNKPTITNLNDVLSSGNETQKLDLEPELLNILDNKINELSKE